jgi:hypothetical protein
MIFNSQTPWAHNKRIIHYKRCEILRVSDCGILLFCLSSSSLCGLASNQCRILGIYANIYMNLICEVNQQCTDFTNTLFHRTCYTTVLSPQTLEFHSGVNLYVSDEAIRWLRLRITSIHRLKIV